MRLRVLLGTGFLFGFMVVGMSAQRDALWKQVDEAMAKGLPKSAITNLNEILPGALKDRAYGEAARAILRRTSLEGMIQGNKPEEKIARLEMEITKAPAEIQPLLASIQAHWYWQYFQRNRWRFMNRTQTASAPGKDFTTWDLPRLFAEIDRQFVRSLTNAATLQKTPVTQFNDLLQAGNMPDSYRPTLYDFLAHEALSFYTAGEQAAARSEDALELVADQPVYGEVRLFGTPEEFLAGKLKRRADEGNPEKALFLFRDLIRFHLNDRDPAALAHVELSRLRWAWNVSMGEAKSALYQAALKRFVDRFADWPIAAEALHSWATLLQQEGNLAEAHRLALRGATIHPQSIGGQLCRSVVREMEAPSLSVNTEHVWNRPLGSLSVRYANVTNVSFRIVAANWNTYLQKEHSRPERLNDKERAELLAQAPVRAWSVALAPSTDFKPRTVRVPAPEQLAPGFYFLLASAGSDFNSDQVPVNYADIWVSDLALVVRTQSGQLQGFVLDAASGEPLAGAEIASWELVRGERVARETARTDELGFFELPRTKQPRGLLLRARYQGRELATRGEHAAYSFGEGEPDRQKMTLFFTDRAIYRPGQTVQYKGICLRFKHSTDEYDVLPGTELTVLFRDSNQKEIARQKVRCNDYGSFAGSFTAPRDRLMGQMFLMVENGPEGAGAIRVEEYKRPKFQVKMNPPKTAPKLDDQVAVTGTAESYTGAAVDGAVVKWRVVREVRWPEWWGWWGRRLAMHRQASQEIAHGTARTGVDGKFQVEFVARPDRAIAVTNEPSFHYTVHADVTDATGETRSADQSVTVGYTALQASMTAEDWQTAGHAVAVKVATSTLDGEGQSAQGVVKLHRLKEPAKVQRGPLAGNPYRPANGDGEEGEEENADLANPNQWALGEVVMEKTFKTDAAGKADMEFTAPAGCYRLILTTQDRFGKKVTARRPLLVVKPDEAQFGLKVPHHVGAPHWRVEAGNEFMALWGTGYEQGRAFVEIEHRGKMVQRYWTTPGRTQQQVKVAVTEAMRGGFSLHVTQVRENRAYLSNYDVTVPWSNKELELKWEHFVSKLLPGAKETWTLVISKPAVPTRDQPAERAVAELVAALYDASLDQFIRHQWPGGFGVFRDDHSVLTSTFENIAQDLQWLKGQWNVGSPYYAITYRHFPPDLVAGWQMMPMMMRRAGRGGAGSEMMLAESAPMAAPMASTAINAVADSENRVVSGMSAAPAKAKMAFAMSASEGAIGGADKPEPPESKVNLAQVSPRQNLSETAFFYPQLVSDAHGQVRLTFTMPEALTTWRFLGFAHDKKLRGGLLEAETVTAKDIMVQPNPPRFLREGDTLEFTVKVSNQSAERQVGKVKLSLRFAANDAPADQELKLAGLSAAGKAGGTELTFDIPAKESRTLSWRLEVPDGCGYLAYKAVGATAKLSDGEEGWLPVLARRILVTESLPLPIRGKVGGGEVVKKFSMAKLLKSGSSSTLKHQSLTVQMVSQPAWYAVMALPYLMEFPHECSEQTFNRYYANALARFIANKDPKIRKVFDLWKGTAALDSPLEKNQDLKSVMLEETPWLRQAQQESQSRRNVGVLFDANRLENEQARTLSKLGEMQVENGLWPWFPGGRGNDYITLYIVTGFGRLRHLGVDVDVSQALRALARLDEWMTERYREILKMSSPEAYVPGSTECLYLYGRSFFLKDRPVQGEGQKAVEFFLARAHQHWLKVGCRQNQGQLAVALQRFGGEANRNVARDIVRSLKERSVRNEEMGLFWRDTELSWWWYHAPIETQAMMIEAFDEVAGDREAVEECRVWLLKQKQTQDWKTTKATADAVYALLLRGGNLLGSDRLVEVLVGGQAITPGQAKSAGTTQPEAGTGFYERRYAAGEIKPGMGDITVKKTDEGVSWGSVHWQYLEDMSKVTPYEGTPLKLKKTLFRRTNTNRGPVLDAVKGELNVGDELVIRVELRVDRDMEYVHLKDQRGSGTEPVNVLSGYRYQDGLGYYESTRDTASHFYIDYLPKGTYVFEYATRVQHRGKYQTGMASIECMYAPEFNSHSESFPLVVK